MSDYSFPNKDDSFHTRVTYTVAAEFIYRLDVNRTGNLGDSLV